MVEWLLEHGADPTIRDLKVHNTPDSWVEYAHHPQLATYLRSIRERYGKLIKRQMETITYVPAVKSIKVSPQTKVAASDASNQGASTGVTTADIRKRIGKMWA